MARKKTTQPRRSVVAFSKSIERMLKKKEADQQAPGDTFWKGWRHHVVRVPIKAIEDRMKKVWSAYDTGNHKKIATEAVIIACLALLLWDRTSQKDSAVDESD